MSSVILVRLRAPLTRCDLPPPPICSCPGEVGPFNDVRSAPRDKVALHHWSVFTVEAVFKGVHTCGDSP